jgi:hypothetical protein
MQNNLSLDNYLELMRDMGLTFLYFTFHCFILFIISFGFIFIFKANELAQDL